MKSVQISECLKPLVATVRTAYAAFAIILANTVILLLVVNLFLHLGLSIKDRRLDPNRSFYRNVPESHLMVAYPDFSLQERKLMLEQTLSRPWVYEDFVHFKERPFQSKYVNVTTSGFRKVKDQGPWPPDPNNINVFVFGGSTTFGWGLPDEQTVPSFLQQSLAGHFREHVYVYNFGTSGYFSTQERILLEQLLNQGYRPNIAIFVDGLNDLWHLKDAPVMWEAPDVLSRTRTREEHALLAVVLKQPMGRAALKVRRMFQSRTKAQSELAATSSQIEDVLERYQRNKMLTESACLAFGCTPVFVWQPVPSYKYDLTYHLFFNDPAIYANQASGFRQMELIFKSGTLGEDFLWCADLQRDEKECLYVDDCHYTAKFGKRFAAVICQMCSERGLFRKHLSK